MNLCDDNRTATIEAAKMALIKGTNIEDSPDEMKVLDNILFRCWQMGWLDRYAPPRHFNAMPKVISGRLAAGHGSNVPMQPNIPPMPSNTSNALDALVDAYKGRSNALGMSKCDNATQSNALDCISRAKAIEALTKDKKALEHIINEMSGYEKEFDRFVGQRNQVDYDIYEIKQLPPVLGTNLAEVGTDCISRQAAISAICNACGKIDCDKMDKCEKLQLSSANTSETPNSSDTISRQAVLSKFEPWLKVDGYNEGERNILKAILYELKFGKFATDTNVGRTDTISRAKAIEALDKRFDSIPMEQTSEILMLRKDLRELPPAQPESDSGRWERHYSRPGVYADLYWHCSKCGYKTDYQYANVNHHYCPHCGRKMEREVSNE